MIGEGNRRLIQVYLGQTSGTSISAYVEGEQVGTTDRTWYDGIGYRQVPEPTSFALLFAGLTASFVLRRRI
jgi:hypothetical protein